jgi:hypothetical protein
MSLSSRLMCDNVFVFTIFLTQIIIFNYYRHIFWANFILFECLIILISYFNSCFSISVSDRPKKYENGNDLGVFPTSSPPRHRLRHDWSQRRVDGRVLERDDGAAVVHKNEIVLFFLWTTASITSAAAAACLAVPDTAHVLIVQFTAEKAGVLRGFCNAEIGEDDGTLATTGARPPAVMNLSHLMFDLRDKK